VVVGTVAGGAAVVGTAARGTAAGGAAAAGAATTGGVRADRAAVTPPGGDVPPTEDAWAGADRLSRTSRLPIWAAVVPAGWVRRSVAVALSAAAGLLAKNWMATATTAVDAMENMVMRRVRKLCDSSTSRCQGGLDGAFGMRATVVGACDSRVGAGKGRALWTCEEVHTMCGRGSPNQVSVWRLAGGAVADAAGEVGVPSIGVPPGGEAPLRT
jgi:hypothetical protein